MPSTGTLPATPTSVWLTPYCRSWGPVGTGGRQGFLLRSGKKEFLTHPFAALTRKADFRFPVSFCTPTRNITQEDSMFAETTEWAPTLPEVRSQGQSHCCPSVSPSSWFCSSDCAWTLQVGLLMGMTSWGGTPGPRKCLAHAEVVILKLGACT